MFARIYNIQIVVIWGEKFKKRGKKTPRYPKYASSLYPLSASGEGKDGVWGEAKAAAEIRGI
jgi:hypothetical protein